MSSGIAGGGLGLGPVFTYEWLTSSRRWQIYAVRALFVSSLLVALVVVWLSDRSRLVAGSSIISSMAQLGQSFFLGVVGTQLALVLLAAPAATAGAICLDRARGTLTHMLVTDLTDSEIVLGKLAARLVPVMGLVFCTMPMMALLTLLGGVAPDALIGALAVTLAVGVLGCSLALLFSLWAGKTHEALLGTYAFLGLWLLSRPMFDELQRLLGSSLPPPSRTADPFLACVRTLLGARRRVVEGLRLVLDRDRCPLRASRHRGRIANAFDLHARRHPLSSVSLHRSACD
jgi:ABC-type transport system involved in multi-copper enzyme maturation permease subunit